MTDRQAARELLRGRRRGLPVAERERHSLAVCQRIGDSAVFEAAERIGLYRAADGELDPAQLGTTARASGAATWYPVVDGEAMQFRRWDGEGGLRVGAFGIEEPVDGEQIAGVELDLVIVPLVGFDSSGHRLGMGKGYYDRAFAARPGQDGPLLIGTAFDEQELESIDPEAHDVALDVIVTPTRWIAPR
ncbi:MAG TPA: 5-formyltetrahydrofolate cyclo-ligase [Microthrixaceae bacterium]|nr:5-formyltetrahydrofolate cyclo-ligase [Microthrixaceae bacterium]